VQFIIILNNKQNISQTFVNLADRIFIMILNKLKYVIVLSFMTFIFTIPAYGQENTKLNIQKSQEIDSILIKKKHFNQTHPTKGYRIQLYYGNEKLAYKFKNSFKKAFPNQNVAIIFDNPDWKTMVGNFRTRIAADSAIVAIKKQFLGAVVVKAPLQLE